MSFSLEGDKNLVIGAESGKVIIIDIVSLEIKFKYTPNSFLLKSYQEQHRDLKMKSSENKNQSIMFIMDEEICHLKSKNESIENTNKQHEFSLSDIRIIRSLNLNNK